MRTHLPFLLSLLAVLMLSACGKRETPVEAARATKTLLVGNGAEPADLDPHLVTAYTDMNIMVALFEGLTVLDERSSEPLPGIASSWEHSQDGLTWTFHLRPEAKWSDGAPLGAEDFVWSFRRILSPKLAAEFAYILWPLKNARELSEGKLTDFSTLGARAVDAHTLRLELTEPCPWLLTLVSNQPWFPVPRPVIERLGAATERGSRWTRPENFVCNGPYRLKEWHPGLHLLVEANPHYHGSAATRLREIRFFPYENIASEEHAFRTGQRHLTYELSPEKIPVYRRDNPAQLRVDPLLETFFLRFNVAKPPLNNPVVRQALARAIDRAALCRSVLKESRVPAAALTPPNTGGYTPPAGIPDDPASARELLAKAGFAGGKGFPQLEIQFKSDDIHRVTMEAIQQMWRRELGIDVALSPLEQKTWLANQAAMSYQVSSSRWVGDYLDPNTFLDLWLSDGGKNQTGWASPAYDNLVREAAHTLDNDRRHALQGKAEALLLEEAPVVPVFHGARVYLIHPQVRNWPPALLGLRRFQIADLE
jgi:oligopeptide transport system substrate-binding protein